MCNDAFPVADRSTEKLLSNIQLRRQSEIILSIHLLIKINSKNTHKLIAPLTCIGVVVNKTARKYVRIRYQLLNVSFRITAISVGTKNKF